MSPFKLDGIKAFISKLSNRERTILYITSVFIMLLLLDKLVVGPVYSSIKQLNEEIRAKEIGIKKSLRILSYKDKIRRNSAKYKNFFVETKSIEEESTNILKEIESIANKSAVYIIDMKPSGVKDVGTSKRYYISLNCEAQMNQLVDFIYNIENSRKLLSIDKYQIKPKSKESTIATCNLSIFKIMIE